MSNQPTENRPHPHGAALIAALDRFDAIRGPSLTPDPDALAERTREAIAAYDTVLAHGADEYFQAGRDQLANDLARTENPSRRRLFAIDGNYQPPEDWTVRYYLDRHPGSCGPFHECENPAAGTHCEEHAAECGECHRFECEERRPPAQNYCIRCRNDITTIRIRTHTFFKSMSPADRGPIRLNLPYLTRFFDAFGWILPHRFADQRTRAGRDQLTYLGSKMTHAAAAPKAKPCARCGTEHQQRSQYCADCGTEKREELAARKAEEQAPAREAARARTIRGINRRREKHAKRAARRSRTAARRRKDTAPRVGQPTEEQLPDCPCAGAIRYPPHGPYQCGPGPCLECGAPTPTRTNWSRLWKGFTRSTKTDAWHHRCDECHRRRRYRIGTRRR